MSADIDTHIRRASRLLCVASCSAIAIAVFSFLGWLLQFNSMMSVVPDWPTMKPATAALIVTMSLLGWLAFKRKIDTNAFIFGMAILLSLCTLFIFLPDMIDIQKPSIATSMCIGLLALGNILSVTHHNKLATAAIWGVIALVLFRILRLILTGPNPETQGIFDSMSLPSTLSIGILTVCASLVGRDESIVRIVTGKYLAARIARTSVVVLTLLPAAVMIAVDYVIANDLQHLESLLAIAASFITVTFSTLFFSAIIALDSEYKENENLRQSLVTTNSDLALFSSLASHDLKEPARKMATFASFLHQDLKDKLSGDDRYHLSVILDASQRMRNLIDSVLTYSDLSRATYDLSSLSVTSFKTTLLDVLNDLELTIAESNVTIVQPPTDAQVMILKEHLYQLLSNLILNGIKYKRNDQAAKITVRLVQNEQVCTVSVIDNGRGIDERYLKSVQEQFAREGAPSKVGGYGIGLATCKRILQAYGSHLAVDSKFGHGSSFSFKIASKESIKS